VIDVELVDRYLVVTQQDQTWLQRNASEQQREFWFVHVSKSVDMRDDEAGCCAKVNASFLETRALTRPNDLSRIDQRRADDPGRERVVVAIGAVLA
jgi:hypothetical protein